MYGNLRESCWTEISKLVTLASLTKKNLQTKNIGILFFLCFALLASTSLLRVWPRIEDHPLPSDEVRFHLHKGDGTTEVGVLAAHAYWQKFGYTITGWLPCTDPSNYSTPTCTLYTHYPPGMYLISSFLLSAFNSLQATRIFFYLLTLVASAIALVFLALSLEIDVLGLSLMAVALGWSMGFAIFADNLFGHGLVLALQGLLFATVLYAKGSKKWLYGGLCLISIFLTVELIPTIFLAPLLLLIKPSQERWKPIRSLWAVTLLAFGTGFFLRIFQNAWHAGFMNAVNDWIQIIRFRILGSSPEEHKDLPKVSMDVGFWRVYVSEWLRYQRIMITKYGQIWLCFAGMWMLYKKKYPQLKLLVGIFLVALSWNFLFVQHSLIHLFTVRYVVWPFVISIGLGRQVLFSRLL